MKAVNLPERDSRIDEKIEAAAVFARPILRHLRELVHHAVPDVQEAIKWGMPHFIYRGKNLAGMAAFKSHCAFLIHTEPTRDDAMGQFGRVSALSDLPRDAERRLRAGCGAIDRALVEKQAAGRSTVPSVSLPQEQAVPDDLAEALGQAPDAERFFLALTAAQRRDYLSWSAEAKRAETRRQRIATTIIWLGEGKRRNWKYQKG